MRLASIILVGVFGLCGCGIEEKLFPGECRDVQDERGNRLTEDQPEDPCANQPQEGKDEKHGKPYGSSDGKKRKDKEYYKQKGEWKEKPRCEEKERMWLYCLHDECRKMERAYCEDLANMEEDESVIPEDVFEKKDDLANDEDGDEELENSENHADGEDVIVE